MRAYPCAEPEGEKPINVGTADLIYSDSIPQQIQYVALGHLHRYNNVGTHQPVLYSGSPLSYSFSEAGQQKYVAIVDVEPGVDANVTQIPLHSGRQLVRKSFDNVDDVVDWLNSNPNVLVEMTISMDEYLKADDRRGIYQSHDGIIHLIPKIKNEKSINGIERTIDLNQTIDSVFKDYFKSKNSGQEPNEELMNLFNEILNN